MTRRMERHVTLIGETHVQGDFAGSQFPSEQERCCAFDAAL
jgi:hypothetical protein